VRFSSREYKAYSPDSSAGVQLYVEHWAGLRNAVIGPNNRSKLFYFFALHAVLVLYPAAGKVGFVGFVEILAVSDHSLLGFGLRLCWRRTSVICAAHIGYVCGATRRIRGRYKVCSGFQHDLLETLHGLDKFSNDVLGVAPRYVQRRYMVCSGVIHDVFEVVTRLCLGHYTVMSEACIGYVGGVHLCIKAVGTTIIIVTIGMYKKKAARQS
jgi:hypothetical protein